MEQSSVATDAYLLFKKLVSEEFLFLKWKLIGINV
jgi:hypothetical protein